MFNNNKAKDIDLEKIMNSTMVGRESEIKEIIELFENVLEGDSSILMLKGQAGIGKTSLVQHVVAGLQNNHVTFVQGKHNQYSNNSYFALAEIIESLFEHILTLSADEYKILVEKIEKELGNDLYFIYHISPLAKKIFTDYKPKSIEAYSKSKYRIRKSVEKFFLCISEVFFPLVIFIDDLQWADEATIDIITMLCKESELFNFMLIISFRDNIKSHQFEKLEGISKFINLEPLTEKDIKLLLEDVFGQDIENAKYLERITYGLTLGNPFYVKKIFELLCEENVLIYKDDINGWVSDIGRINLITLPTDIEQIMKFKMRVLDDEEKLVLEYISCLDGKASLEELKLVLAEQVEDVERILLSLSEKSFIISQKSSFQFIHDIILGLVYNGIDESIKKLRHYEIAKKIIDSDITKLDDRNIAFIASQLIRSDFDKWDQAERDSWLELLYKAGEQSINILTYDRGVEIFNLCRHLLSNYSHNKDKVFEQNVLLELAKCQHYSGNFNESEMIFSELINTYTEAKDIINIKRNYMQMLAFKGDNEGVMGVGKEVLVLLDFSYDINDFHQKLGILNNLYSDEIIENLDDKRELNDSRSLNILGTLYQMMPSAQILNSIEFMYILILIAIISGEEGHSEYSSIGYAASAYVFYHIFNDDEKGKKLAKLVLSDSSKMVDERIRMTALAFYASFVHHWSNPIDETIDLLESINSTCLELGEVSYFEYTIASLMFAYSIRGYNINDLNDKIQYRINSLNSFGIVDHQFISQFIVKILRDHLEFLEVGKGYTEYIITDSLVTEEDASNLVYLWFCLLDLYIDGDIARAYAIVDSIKGKLDRAKGHIIYTEVVFYSLLVRIEYHDKLAGSLQYENSSLIEEYILFIEKVCNHYPGNHNIRYLYAKGAYDALFNSGEITAGLYNEGIKLAQECDNFLLEAIGNLLAAKFYNKHDRLAEFYKNESALSFKKWGALYISEKLIGNEKLVQQTEVNYEDNLSINEVIYQLIQQIEPMNENEAFLQVLESIVSTAGCEFGAILLEKSDKMYVNYEKKVDRKAIYYSMPLGINYKDNISQKIIRYVARTGELVSLIEKPTSGIFMHDQYVKEKNSLSIYCIPFFYFNILIGVVYLESKSNNGINNEVNNLINGIIPTLMTKCEKIKDVSIGEFLNPSKNISPLTDRETDILVLVAEGLSNIEISNKIYISTGTVKNHLNSIYGKLEVDSRIKAVIKAKELNII